MNASISPRQLLQEFGDNDLILDVRTPVEFEEFHLQGATLAPLDFLDPSAFESKVAGTIFVVCKTGKRAAVAVEKLRFGGVENVRHVQGGTLACVEAGFQFEGTLRECSTI